ncbi:DUF1697 domain-containing protein [Nakamurella flava]|uniref:DUF1697 domain-containing protein n=1 Tax=Nakamurella flava TaxID=2576308 RepID=A0A4U6QKX1_9ACTN|nr:DUF1697 domain-containing protein [Nakamurella flava]TKV61123.1 DUF1697 domain-containing protein [Nakamurella flava]
MSEQTLLVLIRGINVGTAKQVGMADLRDALGAAGYVDVRTHLRSGNVLIRTDRSPLMVAGHVEDVLAGPLGVPARVLVRTVSQVRSAVAADPFAADAPDGAKHFLGFLDHVPDSAAVRAVAGLDTAPDRAELIGDHLYLWCPNGISKGPLSRIDWDRRLRVTVTMRNWNTVNKLLELAGA